MEKYHFNIRLSNIKYYHAGSKAVDDCKSILLKNGFKDLEISFIKSTFLMPLNLLKLLYYISIYRIGIAKGSLIITQYPLLGINKYFKYFAVMLKSKACKLICIIHDIDSIRSVDNEEKIKHEINSLSAYDAVIAHNYKMEAWLIANGYKGKIIKIELFDYLVTGYVGQQLQRDRNYTNIDFAGNLGRCAFLPGLTRINSLTFNLYGPGYNASTTNEQSKIKWRGSFSPEEIVRKLDSDFGLVWDGTSIERCDGLMGHYLQFNTPHKTSLYLVSGIPVIVPQSAAISKFICDNNLGFAVNSLLEINDKLLDLTGEQYEQMKNNALLIGEKLRNGQYLKNAVGRIINIL